MKVSAIREHGEAQWVQIPTDAAQDSYEMSEHAYAEQSVFAAAQEMQA